MKLYTEEQILNAIKSYVNSLDTLDNIIYKDNELLILSCFSKSIEIVEKLTPIELPSDDEIEDYAEANCYDAFHEEGLEKGAKWIKEQILNQNKGQMGLFTERDEETPNQIIIGKLNRIEAKLDAVIKAMYDYDGNDEYGESSFEAFQDEAELNKRMDIIGQNGNEGSHYVTNEEADDDAKFSDYGQRIAKEVMRDENNIRVGKDKDNNTQPKQKQYYKNKRSKRSDNKH